MMMSKDPFLWNFARSYEALTIERDRLAAEVEQLRTAARAFLRTACRPGDDSTYDDLYDNARKALHAALADRPAAKEGS